MFQKILCAVDGSGHSNKALDLAIDMAKKYDAELFLLHIINRQENSEALQHFAAVEGLSHNVNTEIQRHQSINYRVGLAPGSAYQDSGISSDLLVEVGQYILDGAKDRAARNDVKKVSAWLEDGDPADRILGYIDKGNIDCVLMGSRGLSNVKGLFLRSVSHKVANRSSCTCISVK